MRKNGSNPVLFVYVECYNMEKGDGLIMSALGDMIRLYEKTMEDQEAKLNEIKQVAESCFKVENAPTMEEVVLEILTIINRKMNHDSDELF